MQPLKVLQVAVEKWILVVPLDLKSNRFVTLEVSGERLYVVDFVGDGFLFNSVDDFLDFEVFFPPPKVVQCTT